MTVNDKLEAALKAARICIFEVDIKNQLYTYFENAEDVFGISGEKILEDVRPFSQLSAEEYRRAVADYFSHPEDEETIEDAFQSIFSGEKTTYIARMKVEKTDYVWCKIDATPVTENGVVAKMIGVITNINDLKTRTDDLQRQIMLDSFTGLYNKTYAREMINVRLQDSKDQRNALLLIDLDGFKRVNDQYGHATGDQVLLSVADNLRNLLTEKDIVGRFGGDEFIILITNIDSEQALKRVLDNLIRSDDNILNVTKSMGVAIYPDDGTEYKILFNKADRALYHSKKCKNCYSYYSEL